MGAVVVKTRLVRIGNSHGIRIPRAVVEQAGLQGELELRIPCRFGGKDGSIALDQIRAVDRSRLVRRLGRIGNTSQEAVLTTLAELFAR